ncbi:MAG: methyltransferase domain-containing protein [Candidatus Rokuibacteriota bacterium]
MERLSDGRELLDGALTRAARAATLADVDRLNAWFGGYALSLRAMRRLAGRVPAERTLVVADVGGGRADLAVRIVRWARRAGRRVRILVVDRDAETLALAADACRAYPEIVLLRGDATALPLGDGRVDVAVVALTLHHLEPDGAAACLAEMTRAARLGVVVNDLLRGYLTLGLVWLVTRALGMHPVSCHDGPVSVRRAYAPAELRALAGRAGVARVALRRHALLGRLVAVLA